LFFVALERKDLPAAERFKEEAERLYGNGRGSRLSQRPLVYYRGSLDLKYGRTAEAIDEDCLANAYIEAGRFDEGVAEYQRILKLNPNYPLVHYHLAQAYERFSQPERARAEYEIFLQVWKDADPDVPELVAAKKALSSLASQNRAA
jgi:tetratricopeptide (TPR) repeat protein